MMYTIEYSKEADKTLRKWKKSNPNLFKKATKILMDIMKQSFKPRNTITINSNFLKPWAIKGI